MSNTISDAIYSLLQIQTDRGIQSNIQHRELLHWPIRERQLLMPIYSRVVNYCLSIRFVKKICLTISGYNLEMLGMHGTTTHLNLN